MTFRSLPVKNLLGNKSRSMLLFIFSVLLSFSLFSGFTIIQSLKNGLKSLEYRLGADIMVVPKTAYEQNGLEEILLKGNRA